MASASLCFLSPLLGEAPTWIFLPAFCIWGVVVVGDSPQFSALNARTAPREYVGSALTMVTCLGFLITVPAIEFTAWLSRWLEPRYMLVPLGLGPVLGWLSLRRLQREGDPERR